MDPFSIIVSVETLVAAALSLAKVASAAVGAIHEAPIHINALKNDLSDFYIALGHLQCLISEAKRSASMTSYSDKFKTVNFDIVENSLKNSVINFNNLNILLNGFKPQDWAKEVGKWKSPKWMFIESKIESFRRDLIDSKITLNTELSILTWSSAHIIYQTVDRIEADLVQHHEKEDLYRIQLSERLENLEATRLNQSSHTETDRAAIRYDPDYSLRHHLDSAAASTMSDETNPSTASFIVSDLGEESEILTLSDQASFFSAFSRPSHEFFRDPPSPDESINPQPSKSQPTIKLPVFEVFIQTHTGAKLKVEVTQEDTPDTVLSRLQQVDGFWSYWSEKGYLTHAGKAIKPTQGLKPYLDDNDATTIPTFCFRTGYPLALLQESRDPSNVGLPNTPFGHRFRTYESIPAA